ncbi:MAG: ATP phosphoribosyltransferase [Halofilum sp. (in: g-proteobacteria)]|nr:ATP phosphoribosyltransferase [Halofilum sp. (in: g-proteobacteria)]
MASAAHRPLTIALSKGRILDQALPLLAAAGLRPAEDPASTRRLILPASGDDLRFVVVRAADVPTYVQYGGAELGIAGKDVLLEHGGDGLYEPLDLGIAACRLMLAGRAGAPPAPRGRPRVATKYVNTTHLHFARQGRQVEIIKLYGSMELAPLMGLADWIVDLVDTGNTLKANGLEPYETIAHVTSRLVVNRAAMKTRNRELRAVIDAVRTAVDSNEPKQATSR